eukprot:753932-Hanusia_phi.AAC.2
MLSCLEGMGRHCPLEPIRQRGDERLIEAFPPNVSCQGMGYKNFACVESVKAAKPVTLGKICGERGGGELNLLGQLRERPGSRGLPSFLEPSEVE